MDNQDYSQNRIPKGLSVVAGNRDLITTPEFAQVFNVQPQTVRKSYCLTGHAYGIRPTKIGKRLLWSVAQITEKLKEAV
ncbi:hypothetical protein ICN30_08195 [Polynucleobacter sp. 31A-FELB]|uniref:hypothetical protein n=1 Tax=Polynucleobacter sp. 31A-FELB TaxID=2689096 RepID=UPI001C0D64CE|nr:hypothetical protein [Polynucleobacter sp. 31A-FELB]MBU3587803.1 hypothetical protein [Polynucleobacter sp. 31A-FELB]MBU3587812.1 hypothetical protein [Polynucleobacter sp. 31A-FELB]